MKIRMWSIVTSKHYVRYSEIFKALPRGHSSNNLEAVWQLKEKRQYSQRQLQCRPKYYQSMHQSLRIEKNRHRDYKKAEISKFWSLISHEKKANVESKIYHKAYFSPLSINHLKVVWDFLFFFPFNLQYN